MSLTALPGLDLLPEPKGPDGYNDDDQHDYGDDGADLMVMMMMMIKIKMMIMIMTMRNLIILIIMIFNSNIIRF